MVSPPPQRCALSVERTASFLLVPAEPWGFQHLLLAYLCTTENSSLLLFQLSPPSFPGRGCEGFRLSPEALRSCCSPEAAPRAAGYKHAQNVRSLGTRVGFLRLFYCTCAALVFLTGDFFPNSYLPFSHVFGLFHHHSVT